STAHDDSGLSQPEMRSDAETPEPEGDAASVPSEALEAPAAAEAAAVQQPAAPAGSAPHPQPAAPGPLPPPPAAPAVQPPSAATPGASPVVPATASQPAPETGIDVRELQYRGERALQRAAELRPILERMLADTRGGREALAELYDLLRLARE